MASRSDIPLPRRTDRDTTLHAQRRNADRAMLDDAAANLHRYFTFRAGRQGAVQPPSLASFADGLIRGRRDFAGVLINDRGEIAEDAQRPQLLREFRQLEASVGGLTD